MWISGSGFVDRIQIFWSVSCRLLMMQCREKEGAKENERVREGEIMGELEMWRNRERGGGERD